MNRCKVCGGAVYRPTIIPEHPSPYWLHLHQADWVDDPHRVELDDEIAS